MNNLQDLLVFRESCGSFDLLNCEVCARAMDRIWLRSARIVCKLSIGNCNLYCSQMCTMIFATYAHKPAG